MLLTEAEKTQSEPSLEVPEPLRASTWLFDAAKRPKFVKSRRSPEETEELLQEYEGLLGLTPSKTLAREILGWTVALPWVGDRLMWLARRKFKRSQEIAQMIDPQNSTSLTPET